MANTQLGVQWQAIILLSWRYWWPVNTHFLLLVSRLASAAIALDSDIVKALQCLKSLNSQDLMSRALPNIAEEAKFLDDIDQQSANQQGTAIEVVNNEDWTLDTHVDDVHVKDADDNDNDGNVGM